MLKVEIKLLDEDLVDTNEVLYSGSQGAAAFDVRAMAVYGRKENGKVDTGVRNILKESLVLTPGEVVFVGLGFAMHIESDQYAAFLIPRSSASATRVALANTLGLIDSDYTGEVIAALVNQGKLDQTNNLPQIEPKERIAQIYFAPVVKPQFEIVRDFSKSSLRSQSGFGSTGKA